MTKGGVTVEEAMRYTLGGNPTSKLGNAVVNMVRKNPNKNLRALLTQMAPFPRTGVQMVERGLLERTPLGLGQLLSPAMRKGLGNAKTPMSSIIGNAAQGTAVMGLGAAGEENIPTAAQPLIGASLGPYAVPYGLGWGINRAVRGGKPAYSGISRALGEVSPVSREPAAILTRPAQELASRVVPGIVAHIAQAVDPAYNRRTGPAELDEAGYGRAEQLGGAVMARIPGLRERLPEVNRPVDAFGRPRMPDRPFGTHPLSPPRFAQKMVTAGASSGLPLPPAMSLSDPRLRMLHETGVNLGPRGWELSIEGQDIPLDRDQRLRLQRARGQAVELAVQIFSNSPELANMPPGDTKKQIFETILEYVTNAMGQYPTAAALGAPNGQR